MTLLTHQQFKDKWIGKFIDTDSFPKWWEYQCVDLPRQYCKEVYGFAMWLVWWSAKNASLWQTFKSDKRWKEYKPWQVMEQGDILISAPTPTNEHWHIGVIDYFDEWGYWLLEQNTKGWGTATKWNEVKVRFVKRWHPPILRLFRFDKKSLVRQYTTEEKNNIAETLKHNSQMYSFTQDGNLKELLNQTNTKIREIYKWQYSI